MIIKLALRNVFRHKTRSIFGIISIVIGVSLMILYSGIFEGSNISFIESMIETGTGDLRLYTKEYYEEIDKLPLENLFTNYDSLGKLLEGKFGISAVTPRLEFTAFLSDGESDLPLIGVGIDPEIDKRVFNLDEYIERGRYLKKYEQGIMISASTAEAFKVDTGAYITVIARTKYGSISADDFGVVGIFKTYNPDVDEVNFFIDLKKAQEFLDLGDEFSVPVVKLIDRAQAPVVATTLEKEVFNGNAKVKTWFEMTKDMRQIIDQKSSFAVIFVSLLIIMAAFGIMNTMLMAYFERMKEMGTIMALGMTEKQVYRLFLLEGVIIGLIGGIIGFIIGAGFNYLISVKGISIESLTGGGVQYVTAGGKMYSVFDLKDAVIYTLIGFFTSVISTYFPARRIKKLSPAEVLRKN